MTHECPIETLSFSALSCFLFLAPSLILPLLVPFSTIQPRERIPHGVELNATHCTAQSDRTILREEHGREKGAREGGKEEREKMGARVE